MTPTLPPAWQALLKDELQKPYWCSLEQRLGAAYESGAVYPPAQQLFAAFERTPPTCVRAVILGQDPYHEPGQANGLAFSVSRGVKLPPSLQNIYKELEADLGVPAAKSGDLTSWACFCSTPSSPCARMRQTPTRISAGRASPTR